MDAKLKKWIKWLDIIHDDLQQIVIHKNIFLRVGEIVKSNNTIQIPSAYYDFIGCSYTAFMIMGIRRQTKVNSQSISFSRLLKEICESPEKLSREYFKSLYTGSVVEDLADKDFDKFSGDNKNHIDAKMVEEDLLNLTNSGKLIEELADKRIAHYDKQRPIIIPTYNDLDECVELLDKLYCKYKLVLHASWQDTLLPTYQYDWEEVFRHKWLEDDDLSD